MNATLERLRERREEGNEGGFTLIELLIVIVILGILAAIVVFAVGAVTGKSANAACQSDFKTVQVAEEAYKAQIGSYVAVSSLTASTTDAQGFTVGPWLKAPINSTHYTITLDTTSGNLTVTPTSGTAVTSSDAKAACANVTS